MNIHKCGAREKEQFVTVSVVFFPLYTFTSKSVPMHTQFVHRYLPLFIFLSQPPNSFLFRFSFHGMSQSVAHFRVSLSLCIFSNFQLHLCFASFYSLCFFSDSFALNISFRCFVFPTLYPFFTYFTFLFFLLYLCRFYLSVIFIVFLSLL